MTQWIIKELKSHGIVATFFCVGENAKIYPGLLTELKSHGHVIGNHSMRHEKWTSISKSEYLESIKDTSEFVDSNLFRPPYGRMPWTFTNAVNRNYKIIMWTWLSYDFDESVSIEKILSQINRIKAGDILVLHDNERVMDRVKVILPEVIRIVKKKGLIFEVIA